MDKEKELPKRKSTRLKKYDYSVAGVYFVTICTFNRKNILSQIVGAIHESPEIKLTQYGKIVDSVINTIQSRYNAIIDRYVIMPNHLHILIKIKNNEERRAIRESPLPTRSILSQIVGFIKMNSSKEIHNLGYTNVWQRGFYDHVIRNRYDYEEISKYIRENPMRWYHKHLNTDGK